MGKIRHTENDEIELSLVHKTGNYYELRWRFLGDRKFLWLFRIPNKWYSIWEYAFNMYKEGDDPQDDVFWSKTMLNLAEENDRKKFTDMRIKVKTKKQLFDFYGLPAMYGKYVDDMKKYRELKNESERKN